MSTPLDFRSIFRGSKYFEVKNVDSVSIPGFSVVEVDEAESIEDENRTIVHIKRPLVASQDPDLCCVLGPMGIPSGNYGAATVDYPCYTRYTGNTPVNEELWGTTVLGTQLDSAQFGWVIWGDAGEGLVKVNKAKTNKIPPTIASVLLRAQLSGEMCSTDATTTIKNAEILSGLTTGVLPTAATNALKLAGTTDDVIYAVFRPSTSLWEILNVQHVRNTYLEKMVEPSEITTGQVPTPFVAGQDPLDPGCDYKFRKLQTPMIKEPIGGGSCITEAFDEINFAPCAVLTDLQYGRNTTGEPIIEGKIKIVWVPDQCDELPADWVELLQGVECPTGTA